MKTYYFWPTNHEYMNKENPLCEAKFSSVQKASEYASYLHKFNSSYKSICYCREDRKIIYVGIDEETYQKHLKG